MIQMRLWHHDCSHTYVIMPKRREGIRLLKMVCVVCGQDVEAKSVLRQAAVQAKARHAAA